MQLKLFAVTLPFCVALPPRRPSVDWQARFYITALSFFPPSLSRKLPVAISRRVRDVYALCAYMWMDSGGKANTDATSKA